MNRSHEPLQRHIHSDAVSELNELSIRIKLHYLVNFEKRKELADAGKMPPEPTWMEITEILDKTIQEINQCREPYKRYFF